MTVATGTIVEHFNVIEYIRPGHIPGFIYSLSDTLFFSELKNDYATALTLLWALLNKSEFASRYTSVCTFPGSG